jgi:glyoxylase-like metal-dependent hydrolase (beta-lactamase superfamily II)
MKRALILGTVVLVGALSATVAALQQPSGREGGARGAVPFGQEKPSADALMVEKVKNNLFVLRGGGGNTAVFVMANGVAVVDAKYPGWGAPILAKIKELTPKPVTFLINTHTHGDHVSGNVEFPASVDVVVQENTKTNMEKMEIFKANNNGMAKRTFKDKMTIGSGADQIDLYYFGRGHTDGDAWIHFPAHRIVHSGDIFAGKSVPLIDGNNGGSMREMPDTLKKAHAGVPNVEQIINGHTPAQTTWADLKEFADFNQELVDYGRAGLKAGKSPEQLAAEWKLPEKYKGYSSQVSTMAGGLAGRFQLLQKELQ